jgi:FkbM family methyltransferase
MYPNIKVHITAHGIRYALFDQPEIISDEVRRNNFWGVYRLEIADIILRESEPGQVVDIGAHIGTFSIPLSLKYQKHTFEAFEPVPTLNLQLSTNVLLNKLDNIRAYRIGLGEENKIVHAPALDICFTNHGAYSFIEEYNTARNIIPSSKIESYDFRTLDSYDMQNVRLIKVSVSGMTLQVLKGSVETLKKFTPPLLLECWNEDYYENEKQQIKQLLQEVGYKQVLESNGYLYATNNQDLSKSILEKVAAQQPGSLITFRLR